MTTYRGGHPQFLLKLWQKVFFSSLILLQNVVPVSCQQNPSFGSSCTIPHFVLEDTAIGTALFTLTVTGGDFPAVNMTLSMEGDVTLALVNLSDVEYQGTNMGSHSWSSDVILTTELDRDYEPGVRKLHFKAEDTTKQSSSVTCQLVIRDVNDNAPTFQGLPYVIETPENTDIGSVLKSGISATDPDQGAGGNVFLQAQFPDASVAEVFTWSTEHMGTLDVMEISLNGSLDFETRNFFQFQLLAVDGGGLNSSAMVTVTVIDVQDTPPYFLLSSYRAVIQEEQPIGTSVIEVSGVDGDLGDKNDIVYSIVQGREDLFTVDNNTGMITSLAKLDRDNSSMVDMSGIFELTIRATETDDVQPQYGNTTSDVRVVITVEDINDHAPKFSSSAPYTAYIREDAPLDALIYFEGDGYIHVEDLDQGLHSHLNLTVERDGVPWAAFEATPAELYSEAMVLLRVKDTGALEAADGSHLTLQLVAREISTREQHSSTAQVVITVEQVRETTTTPATPISEKITAPEVVVFIIGFLIIFNIVVSVLIIYYMRQRSEKVPKQWVTRKGSKYWVNSGGGRESKGEGGRQNGGVTRIASVMEEVEERDRCDVVPITTVLSEAGKTSARKSSFTTASPPDASNLISFLESDQSQTRPPLANGAAPAANSGTLITTQADVSSLPASGSALDTSSFSRAKKYVGAPPNPALGFVNHAMQPEAISASTYSLAEAGLTSQAADGGLSAAAASSSMQPLTRFSAKGTVSTTMAEVEGPPSAGVTPPLAAVSPAKVDMNGSSGRDSTLVLY